MSVTNKELTINLAFRGGIESLFDNKKKHQVFLPDEKERWTLKKLLFWIRDNLLKERVEFFLQNNTIRPGILILVNDVDWELMECEEYKLCPNDTIQFISTLHGG